MPFATPSIIHDISGIPLPVREISGSFKCSTNGFLTGSLSSQVLLTIENPVTSSSTVFIKKILVKSVPTNISTTVFSYHIGRVTSGSFPVSGTVLVSQKNLSTETNTQAVLRQLSSASIAPGNMWISSPGILETSSGFVRQIEDSFQGESDFEDIRLIPGECLAVWVDANLTSWNHGISIYWQEGLQL